MEILRVENLSFTYPQCDSQTLKGVSFCVSKGDFVAVCGATGSGKSTLLRMLKRELTPLGEKNGEVYYKGTVLENLSERESAGAIGFVMQNPQQQIVTDKVWHELSFGLENLNTPQSVMRRRVSEMASYFGIEEWFDKSVSELSGGQKQLLNLASVMVMQPDILILDEPTAQLDPIAASEFLTTVKKLNTELSLTVILVEHRLEDVIPMCDKLMIIEDGKISHFGNADEICDKLHPDSTVFESMPAAVRLFGALGSVGRCPLSLKDGRRFIESNYRNEIKSPEQKTKRKAGMPVLELHDIWFKYSRELPDVLRGTQLTVYEGESLCILGGNGSGKTTALTVCAGLLKPYCGSIKIFGKKLKEYKNGSLYKGCLSMLPQDVQTLFLKNTVKLELEDAGTDASQLPYDISRLYDKHPYDLSGGEQQLVALAKVLAKKPRILLLDEPTKGLDAHSKQGILKILERLKNDGVTIITVTHDVEFAAMFSDRCALFFRGEITCCDEPTAFFSGNSFYTTAANRMTRGYYENAVTLSDAEKLCRANGLKDGDGL